MPTEYHEHTALVRSMVLSAQITRHLSSIETPAVTAIGNGNAVWRLFVALTVRDSALPSALASDLGVDRSVISRSLNRLQALGLVTRKVDASDRRQVQVSLTARGRRLVREYHDAVAKTLVEVSPLIDELAARLGPAQAADPGTDVTISEHIDRIAAMGDSFSSLLALESEAGVADWKQRAALWVSAYSGTAPISALAGEMRATDADAKAAVAQLERLGLVSVDNAGIAPTVAPTAAGSVLVEREAHVFLENRDSLVTTLVQARDTALVQQAETARG